MHDILWPSLLDYLINAEYTRGINILCKNLAHIAEIKRNASDTQSIEIKLKESTQKTQRPNNIWWHMIEKSTTDSGENIIFNHC